VGAIVGMAQKVLTSQRKPTTLNVGKKKGKRTKKKSERKKRKDRK
jgi:hypothetical protein